MKRAYYSVEFGRLIACGFASLSRAVFACAELAKVFGSLWVAVGEDVDLDTA